LNENHYSGEEIIGTSQDYQTRSWFRGISEHIRKIQIEGHEDAAIGHDVIVKVWIDCSAKVLLSNGGSVVTGVSQQNNEAFIDVLV
jgi:hypothetical protein